MAPVEDEGRLDRSEAFTTIQGSLDGAGAHPELSPMDRGAEGPGSPGVIATMADSAAGERSDRAGRLSRGVWAVLGVTLAYMAVALGASVRGHSGEFLLYLGVMATLIAVVAAVHRRVGLPLAALWGLSFWGMLHMAGGLLRVPRSWPIEGTSPALYNLWIVPGRLKFDQAVHAYGFGLVTWICWLALRRAFAREGAEARPTVGLLTLCVAAGMGFGAANEVVEFLATRVLPETNVGGYDNTGWDLVANLVGGLIAAALIAARGRADR